VISRQNRRLDMREREAGPSIEALSEKTGEQPLAISGPMQIAEGAEWNSIIDSGAASIRRAEVRRSQDSAM